MLDHASASSFPIPSQLIAPLSSNLQLKYCTENDFCSVTECKKIKDIYCHNGLHQVTILLIQNRGCNRVLQNKGCCRSFSFCQIKFVCSDFATLMIISFRTNRSEQTVQTLIRLLLEEQSEQGLHFLLLHLHILETFFCYNANFV